MNRKYVVKSNHGIKIGWSRSSKSNIIKNTKSVFKKKENVLGFLVQTRN